MQHRPAPQNTKSLARLAAEEAFMPYPAARQLGDDASEADPPPLRRPLPMLPVRSEGGDARASKVFRVAKPVVEMQPPDVEPQSPVPPPLQPQQPPRRAAASDKRPGPVHVVFSRLPESRPAPESNQPVHLPFDADHLADHRADSLADPAALGGVSYRQAQAQVRALDAVFADIAFARSFMQASLRWADV